MYHCVQLLRGWHSTLCSNILPCGPLCAILIKRDSIKCENRRLAFFFFKLNKYKVLLSQYLIRTWLSFSWVWFIKKIFNQYLKAAVIKRVIFAKCKLYYNPPLPTFLLQAFLCWPFTVPWREKTPGKLSTRPLSPPAAPSHAPSLGWATLPGSSRSPSSCCHRVFYMLFLQCRTLFP